MKKFVALALALVLVFSMGVPSFGATSVTVDESGVFAPNNSTSNYSTNTAFTNLNILEAIRVLADSSAYDIHTLKGLFSTGSYKTVADALNLYFSGAVADVNSYGNGNLGDMMSTFAYLGREIQGMNYYTPYSGGQATSLDEALNKNLLYIQNQLQVISDSMGATSASSGLMSGWSLSGVPAPDGYSSSWYYTVLRNIYNVSTYFNRLYGGTWADSENYGDSWFYKTYLQNLTMEENSELFEESFLNKSLRTATWNNGFLGQAGMPFADSVTQSLFTIGAFLGYAGEFPTYDYFEDEEYNFAGPAFPVLANISSLSMSYLSRLAYVLADDEEIRLNETIQDSKTEVVDFVGNGITSSNGSSFSLVSGITDGIGFVTDFNEFFSISGVGIGDIFKVFDDTSESLSWFTEETASNIDTVPTTYSRESNPQTEIVTSYYEDRQAEFAEMWGEIIG